MPGQLRIIGGKWRRRLIRFDQSCDVRPTTDSARETLFNWLQMRIEGSRCLDLFAGSGALGFEALSRGTGHVVFVDSDERCINQIRRTASEFQSVDCEIVHIDAEAYIAGINQEFDIAFVDPPFHRGMAKRAVELLTSGNYMSSDAVIYVETEETSELCELPSGWTELRKKKSGSRLHYLLGRDTDN